MEQIVLDNVLPVVFRDRTEVTSDVWHRSLTFERGKTTLVRAASGTGKSSLCAYLTGQRADYEGIINIDGRNIRTLTEKEWTTLRQRTLSQMFQELRLFPELTAMENVLIKNTLTSHLKKKRIREWMERLGIADKEQTLVGKMSFGQQQRVAVIRALTQPFDFLILDEPVSHLDDVNAKTVAEMVGEEVKRQGAGLIVTSIGRDLPMEYDTLLNM